MKLLQRRSGWDRIKDPLVGRQSRVRAAVRSGLVGAGALAGLTAVSSAVSSVRGKRDK